MNNIGSLEIGILVHLVNDSYSAVEMGCSDVTCFNERPVSLVLNLRSKCNLLQQGRLKVVVCSLAFLWKRGRETMLNF